MSFEESFKKNMPIILIVILVLAVTVGLALYRNFMAQKNVSGSAPEPTNVPPLNSDFAPEPTGVPVLSPEESPFPTYVSPFEEL